MRMAKRENWRVVVEPRRPGNFGFARIGGMTQSEEQWEADCEELKRQIKRHVDDIEDIHVECDTNHYCEHCGSDWTEHSPTYNGGCCEKDQENDPEAQTPPTAA